MIQIKDYKAIVPFFHIIHQFSFRSRKTGVVSGITCSLLLLSEENMSDHCVQKIHIGLIGVSDNLSGTVLYFHFHDLYVPL